MLLGPFAGLMVFLSVFPASRIPALGVVGILLAVAGGWVVVAGVTYPLGVALNTERTPDGPVRHNRNTVDCLPLRSGPATGAVVS